MKTLVHFMAIGLFGISSVSFAANSNSTIEYYGTGNDGDNSTGLRLKNPEKQLSAAAIQSKPAPRIEYYGTGNDGDNSTGLRLKNPETSNYVAMTYPEQPNVKRVHHYKTGNDGDNTSGIRITN